MIRSKTRLAGAVGIVIFSFSFSAVSHANPVPLPFTYVYETLPQGEGEIEQYVDLTPVKALSVSTGNPVWYAASQFQTEYEYGITDRLELGLYVTVAPTVYNNLVPTSTATLTEGTGLKERLRYRIADEGVLPVDIALYGEVVESDLELEFEGKIILQKRFGSLRIAANLWAEEEYEYAANAYDTVLNPTLGATYQVTPVLHLGVEGWMRGEWPDVAPPSRPFALGPHEFVGPTVMLQFGRLWWTTGAYLRVDDFERKAEPNDNYGPIWIRTIIGVGL
jgi:hypothetical protein